MSSIKKTILITLIPLLLGLAGNFIKNKFDVFASDLNTQKVQIEKNKILSEELKLSQEEMKKYVDLNLKLTNDKIRIQKQYIDEIARINNEKFDKITLFSKPGNSTIIHGGMLDINSGKSGDVENK